MGPDYPDESQDESNSEADLDRRGVTGDGIEIRSLYTQRRRMSGNVRAMLDDLAKACDDELGDEPKPSP